MAAKVTLAQVRDAVTIVLGATIGVHELLVSHPREVLILLCGALLGVPLVASKL